MRTSNDFSPGSSGAFSWGGDTLRQMRSRERKFRMIAARAMSLCNRPAFVQSNLDARPPLSFLYLYPPFLLSKPNKPAARTYPGQPLVPSHCQVDVSWTC